MRCVNLQGTLYYRVAIIFFIITTSFFDRMTTKFRFTPIHEIIFISN